MVPEVHPEAMLGIIVGFVSKSLEGFVRQVQQLKTRPTEGWTLPGSGWPECSSTWEAGFICDAGSYVACFMLFLRNFRWTKCTWKHPRHLVILNHGCTHRKCSTCGESHFCETGKRPSARELECCGFKS